MPRAGGLGRRFAGAAGAGGGDGDGATGEEGLDSGVGALSPAVSAGESMGGVAGLASTTGDVLWSPSDGARAATTSAVGSTVTSSGAAVGANGEVGGDEGVSSTCCGGVGELSVPLSAMVAEGTTM